MIAMVNNSSGKIYPPLGNILGKGELHLADCHDNLRNLRLDR